MEIKGQHSSDGNHSNSGDGKQSPREFGKQSPREFGKQSPREFGKQSPREFGKQSPREFGKQSPREFGKQSPRDRLLPLMFEMGRLLKSEMTRDDASLPSYLHIETLRFIQEKNMPTMSEIADYLKIAPPTATALMNPFVKEGVIERTEDPEDRRRVRLSLSAKGVELLKQTMLKRKKAFEQVTSSLSDQDVEELSRILKIITQN